MSAPVHTETNDSSIPTMYAPPWARDEARTAGDAGLAAVDKALNASDAFRRTLPPAAPLQTSRRWREPTPFDGDIAAKHLRERPSLDPATVAPPPLRERGSVGVLARVGGAVGLAALAAFFVVGAVPQQFTSRVVAADRIAALPERATPGAEPAALAERFAAVPAAMAAVEPPMVTQPVSATAAPPVAVPPPAAPVPQVHRSLDREELAMLLKRSEELIQQGDIASARLMLTRAAEAGDARAALALGATFDKDVLRKLGVLGVSGDASQAKAWYAKAAEFGSGEATKRLEIMAHSR